MARQTVSCSTSTRDCYQLPEKEGALEKIPSISVLSEFCVTRARKLGYNEQVGRKGLPGVQPFCSVWSVDQQLGHCLRRACWRCSTMVSIPHRPNPNLHFNKMPHESSLRCEKPWSIGLGVGVEYGVLRRKCPRRRKAM